MFHLIYSPKVPGSLVILSSTFLTSCPDGNRYLLLSNQKLEVNLLGALLRKVG